MHDNLTQYGVLDDIIESIQKDVEEKYNSLFKLDDVTASLKNKKLQILLKRTTYNRRHYRLSIIILVQSNIAMPLSIRKTISHFISYKPSNKKVHKSFRRTAFSRQRRRRSIDAFRIRLSLCFSIWSRKYELPLYKVRSHYTKRCLQRQWKRLRKARRKIVSVSALVKFRILKYRLGAEVEEMVLQSFTATYTPPHPLMPTSMPYETGRGFAPKKNRKNSFQKSRRKRTRELIFKRFADLQRHVHTWKVFSRSRRR